VALPIDSAARMSGMDEGVAGPAMTIAGAVGAAAGVQPALSSSRRIAVIVRERFLFIGVLYDLDRFIWIYLLIVLLLLFVKFITNDYTGLEYVVKSVLKKINQNDEAIS
jgi:hypothetical protein